ncbi:hypothetical protein B0T18DRAFT_403542 [Schizothecium vesticola]|uniref:Uncharacterized protein n=1 Tax=Schizothecium vesticola TaxID=314040 RepID=A0AA40KA82_9PEZI|nr:hypothetical protein B0T18DRAFT_403542 [Schizothecium vesticola]
MAIERASDNSTVRYQPRVPAKTEARRPSSPTSTLSFVFPRVHRLTCRSISSWRSYTREHKRDAASNKLNSKIPILSVKTLPPRESRQPSPTFPLNIGTICPRSRPRVVRCENSTDGTTLGPSLSPSRFDDTAFDDFVLKAEFESETSVMANVIPTIAGKASIPNEHNLQFANCATLTGDITVKPTPDFFDGTRPDALHKSLINDLDRLVVPTKHANMPVAPNFFLKVQSQKGSTAVVRRQACLDIWSTRHAQSAELWRGQDVYHPSLCL